MINVLIVGRVCLTATIGSIILMFLPDSIVSRVRILCWARAKVRGMLGTFVSISMEGPFVKLFVWCGRRFCGTTCSSRCQAPSKVRGKSISCSTVELRWSPCLPLNPCHEENYVVSWRRVGEEDTPWKEKILGAKDYEALTSKMLRGLQPKRFKVQIDCLPAHAALHFRVCAVGRRGRGNWSPKSIVRTLARPSADGGLHGPLASRNPLGQGRLYHWSQSKHEVGVRVPVAAEWRAKDMRVTVTPTRLEIRHMDSCSTAAAECGSSNCASSLLLAGPLSLKVQADEVFWEIEENEADGRQLAVTLRKADLMAKWPSLLEGDDHPCIDTELLRLVVEGNAMNELACHDLWD